MFYERIVISGCLRFSVSGRNYIEIRPTSKVQMILGTNGSGKSSLAQLGFSPLPIDPKFMKPGGYFIKEGTYKGDRYYLEGRYDNKPTFTFKKNGEVLLEDGIVSNYLDLVRIHLDYNKWLHELLTGRIQFTALGPGQRQELLSKISKSDFSHAFRLLTKYKKLHQHYLSVIKFLQGRINEEETRLLDETVIEKLLADKKSLNSEYVELQRIQIPEYKKRVVSLEKLFDNLNLAVDNFLTAEPLSPIAKDFESLDKLIEDSTASYNKFRGQLELINREVVNYQQQLGFLDNDESDLMIKREELKRLREAIHALEELPSGIPSEYLSHDSIVVVETLQALIATMPSFEPDPALQMELERSVMETEMALNKYESVLFRIESTLKMYKDIEHVDCPSCKHKFQPGVDPAKVQELLEKKEKGIILITESKDSLKSKHETLSEYIDKKVQFDALESKRAEYHERHQGLFKYIDSLGGLVKGRMLLGPLLNYKRACDIQHKRHLIESKIERLAAVTEKLEELDAKKSSLSVSLEKQSGVLSDLVEKMNVPKREIQFYQEEVIKMEKEEKRYDTVLSYISTLTETLDDELNRIAVEVRDEQMSRIISEIAASDETINKQTTIKALINDFQKQLETAKEKSKVLGEIVSTLSPKTGLIAEQITLSIGGLLAGLNQLFDKVWGYPLEIKLGQVGENGLDYRFPMVDSSHSRDDVADGSDSMVEMVNRAVVLMSYYSMDLSDLPLFLDEPGRTFDKVHKLNLIPLIRDLSDSVRFSQILLISHSEDVQTAFPNSQTVIMDERNITYPHPFNEHVTFEEPEDVTWRTKHK